MSISTEAVWAALGADLRQFIRRRVSDEHVADDLLQETFIRVHRGMGQLSDTDRLAAWVHQIARNVIHDHYRKTTDRALPVDQPEPAAEQAGGVSCGCGSTAEWLGQFIQTLPEQHREAVQLAEVEGLSQQEIADRLGLSVSGAKSRVQRGRAMLKDVLNACCTFEIDRRGNIVDIDPKREGTFCNSCGDSESSPCCSKPVSGELVSLSASFPS